MTRVLRAAEPELSRPAPCQPLSADLCRARADGGWEACQVLRVICSQENSTWREREVAFSVPKVTAACPSGAVYALLA